MVMAYGINGRDEKCIQTFGRDGKISLGIRWPRGRRRI
jgi:hypothetical protein